jgi:hypothetical protein
MRSVVPALLLLAAGILAIIVVVLLWGTMFVGSNHTGGCNNIPLVNGRPAYNCNLPHN